MTWMLRCNHIIILVPVISSTLTYQSTIAYTLNLLNVKVELSSIHNSITDSIMQHSRCIRSCQNVPIWTSWMSCNHWLCRRQKPTIRTLVPMCWLLVGSNPQMVLVIWFSSSASLQKRVWMWPLASRVSSMCSSQLKICFRLNSKSWTLSWRFTRSTYLNPWSHLSLTRLTPNSHSIVTRIHHHGNLLSSPEKLPPASWKWWREVSHLWEAKAQRLLMMWYLENHH